MITISRPSTASRSESAARAWWNCAHSRAFAGVRLNPTTSWLAATRWPAMGAPITPKPMKAIFLEDSSSWAKSSAGGPFWRDKMSRLFLASHLAHRTVLSPNRKTSGGAYCRFRLVTQHFPTRQLRFFLTAPSPCPYLPGREERKVFAHLPMLDGAAVNDTLTQGGFRRSQNIAYRPACENCAACVSARLPVGNYVFSRSERRVLARNDHLTRHGVEAEATRGQFDVLRGYLASRHPGGGMPYMTRPHSLPHASTPPVLTPM